MHWLYIFNRTSLQPSGQSCKLSQKSQNVNICRGLDQDYIIDSRYREWLLVIIPLATIYCLHVPSAVSSSLLSFPLLPSPPPFSPPPFSRAKKYRLTNLLTLERNVICA